MERKQQSEMKEAGECFSAQAHDRLTQITIWEVAPRLMIRNMNIVRWWCQPELAGPLHRKWNQQEMRNATEVDVRGARRPRPNQGMIQNSIAREIQSPWVGSCPNAAADKPAPFGLWIVCTRLALISRKENIDQRPDAVLQIIVRIVSPQLVG